jgi:hypothetical protein
MRFESIRWRLAFVELSIDCKWMRTGDIDFASADDFFCKGMCGEQKRCWQQEIHNAVIHDKPLKVG